MSIFKHNSAISPRVVFSIAAFTIRAATLLSSFTSRTVIIGVEIAFEALIISFKQGTLSVTFFDETPAK